MTASRSSVGSSTTTSGPWLAISLAKPCQVVVPVPAKWKVPNRAVPAFAAAALFVTFGPRPEPVRVEITAAAASPYSLPDDGYGPCGRRGLGDFMASERF